ncbi:MAG TPA: autotransporter-associated beta strand repeat-containing protein [Phycisphaerae bacterium]|nr:autotransporter-associated beta strand repeat-containing protein [Phycisphaerae bacterium]HQL75251.1 autotransporter-associated beta strand repeat-containing protein [Phycisphaerae bacterium]
MVLCLSAGASFAAPLTWDSNGATAPLGLDGAGTWDTATPNWSDGANNLTWVNANADTAVFGNGGTAGTVALGTGITVGGLTFNAGTTGNYLIQSNTLTLSGTPTIAVHQDATINSLIAGTAFTKTGSGILNLNPQGSNSYSGTITVAEGTLLMNGTGGDGTIRGNVVVQNGATFQIGTANRMVNSGIVTVETGGTFNAGGLSEAFAYIAGNGAISNMGTFELDLGSAGPQTFSGTLGGGLLRVRGNNSGGTQILTGTSAVSSIEVRRGSAGTTTLELAGSGTTTVSGTTGLGYAGSGSAVLNIKNSHVLTTSNLYSGEQSGHGGTINQSGGTVNVTGTAAGVGNGQGTFRLGHWGSETSTYNMQGGVLNVTADLSVGWDGTGVFNLSNGQVTANRLVVNNSNSMNTTGSGTFNLTGGTLTLGTGGIATAGGTAAINLGGGTMRASGSWSSALAGTLTGTNGNVTFDTNGNTITWSGALGGAGGLRKISAGTLTLSGTNNYAGQTVAEYGTLSISNASALGSTAGNTVIVGSNGSSSTILSISGGLTFNEPLWLQGTAAGRAQLLNASGNNTWAGPIDVTSTNNLVQISVSSGSLILAGDITGTMSNGSILFLRGGGSGGSVTGSVDIGGGTLAKTDDNAWTVGAAGETYVWGGTNVARGTIKMGAANVVPASSVLNIGQNDGANATFDLNGYDQTVGGLTYILGSGGTKSITNSSATAATLTVNSAANYTFAGPITGNLALTKDGAGMLTLTGANTFTGLTTVAGGTLNLNGPGGGNNDGAIKGNITIDPGATLLMSVNNVIVNSSLLTVNGTWDMNGKSDAIGYLAGSGQVTNTGGITLDLGGGATRDFAGGIAGGGGVNVRGNNAGATTSTQIFSGTNTYTGTTTVGNGTLLVNGSIAGSAVVNGGTLGGDGTIGGTVSVAGGAHLSPGASIGDLDTGSLTLGIGSFFDVELTPAACDRVDVTGAVSLTDAILNLSIVGDFASYGGTEYVLIDNDGDADPVTGTFDSLPGGSVLNSLQGQFVLSYTGGDGNDVTLTAVPEPITMGLFALAGAGLGGYLRRRRR